MNEDGARVDGGLGVIRVDHTLTCPLGFGCCLPAMCSMACCTYHIPEYYSLVIESKSGSVLEARALQHDADHVLSLLYEEQGRLLGEAPGVAMEQTALHPLSVETAGEP